MGLLFYLETGLKHRRHWPQSRDLFEKAPVVMQEGWNHPLILQE